MRTWLVTLSAAAWVVAASPAFPQLIMSGMSGSDGKSVTITINMASGLGLSVITGAPYSGRQSMKSVQTLADGTRLTRGSPSETKTYRDSMGRVRTERPAFPASAGSKPPASFTLVEIQDPVAGYRYALDSANHVAHRAPLQSRVVPAATALAAVDSPSFTQKLSDGVTATSEPLGTQVMSGVTVVGRRTTLSYPAGSRVGNDRPLSTVTETWITPQGIVLLSKSTGLSESTTTMEDFSAAEPDPTLFLIPSDYQIVDETGPFKIVVPRAAGDGVR